MPCIVACPLVDEGALKAVDDGRVAWLHCSTRWRKRRGSAGRGWLAHVVRQPSWLNHRLYSWLDPALRGVGSELRRDSSAGFSGGGYLLVESEEERETGLRPCPSQFSVQAREGGQARGLWSSLAVSTPSLRQMIRPEESEKNRESAF